MLVKTLIMTVCVIGVTLAAESPVFLFGASGPSKPSLQRIAQEEFAHIVVPLLKDHMILAFQENDLTLADLHSCGSKNAKSEFCYPHLKSVSQRTYYANVEDAAGALAAVANKNEKNSVSKHGKLEAPLKCEVGKVVFVKFNDPERNRQNALAAHDAAIASIVNELSCPVVYLYMPTPTNAPAVLKRSRRDTAAATGGYLFREGADLLVFFTTLSINVDGAEKATEIVIDTMTVTKPNSTDLSVTLTGGSNTLKFDVLLNRDGYYYMKQLIYNDNTQFRTTDVNAPPVFSYFCGDLTLYASDGSNTKLLWKSLQFQAPFGSTKDTNFIFGDSWNCVGFFSPAILSGLFVTILLLAITFTGICCMMDINTMDRFDDPKGKTITINTSE